MLNLHFGNELKMNDAPNQHSFPVVDYMPASPLTRVREARWLLAACLVLAAAATLVYGIPWWVSAVSVSSLAAVAAFLPRRSRSRALQVGKRRELRRMWPGTGMKMTVDALPSPCFVADSRGITRYVNQAALSQYGDVKPGDPLSFSLRAPSLLEAFDRVCTNDKAERISWTEKVPTEAWFEAHLSPVRMPGSASAGTARKDGPDFILVVIQDLTEQRRLERMRTDFVANASHELRTPLASLSGFIETLQGPARDDIVARDRFLQIMQEQAGRMRRLIDDILSLSRIELKAHVRPAALVDLTEVVRHTRDALGPVAHEMEINIEAKLPGSEAIVNGDRDELIQVVENLIENALKYGADGGKITVSLLWKGQMETAGNWELSVQDYGAGISAEHLPRLTERFYRANAYSSSETKGTGLGLAIVKHILNRHRARLEIESEPGNGAIFRALFPPKEHN